MFSKLKKKMVANMNTINLSTATSRNPCLYVNATFKLSNMKKKKIPRMKRKYKELNKVIEKHSIGRNKSYFC